VARLSLPGSRPLLLAWGLPVAALAVALALGGGGALPLSALALIGAAFLLGGALLFQRERRRKERLDLLLEALDSIGHGCYEPRREAALAAPRCAASDDDDLGELARSIDWMAERVRLHLEAVVGEKEKLSAVLNGMWEGVVVLTADGRIRGVNRAMEQVFPGIGLRLGSRPLEVVPSVELQDGCNRLLADAHTEDETFRLRLDEDRNYDVNLVRPAASSGLGLILVFHDVSEMERLKNMRSDFAANVSHELRTPLTSIKGYAETLLSDAAPPPDTARRFMEVILKNANHMGKMISDLLALSRIESGRDGATPEPIAAQASLRATWEGLEPMAQGRRVELENHLPDDLPPVLADPDRLGQVFRNLLENAIKFCPEGSRITVSGEVEGAMVRLRVRDYGPGIPRAQQARVFERFYSVERHRRNEYGSTGLGLAICRHVVRDFGGEIGVASPPEDGAGGTEFHFTVPRADKTIRAELRKDSRTESEPESKVEKDRPLAEASGPAGQPRA
jgi:two-component system phosphate regulon sensor histidine kinase PhoR